MELLSAFIGAAATIIAAFIARGYVTQQFNSPKNISGFPKAFSKFFSVFNPSNARIYVMKDEEVLTDEKLGITLINDSFETRIILPNKKTLTFDNNPGECSYLKIRNKEYRVMYIENRDRYNKNLHIYELREMSDLSK
ncbi:MAG: hypothetical protein KBC43_11960 [Bacteroidales bacterium]|nr:hypothetical protein [Bacteroidales bacterium]